MSKGWAKAIAATTGAVIGYVGSRALGYDHPALFIGFGVFVAAVIVIAIESLGSSRRY